MKKYIFFTSLLALTACDGGGGGGTLPAIRPVTHEAIESNKSVTEIPSQILVASDGTVKLLNRSGASGQSTIGGIEYTAYRLDDVDFETAENFETDIEFTIDGDGKITGIDYNGQRIARTGDDTNTFSNEYATYTMTSGKGGLNYSDFGLMEIQNAGADHVKTIVPYAGGYDSMEIDDDKIVGSYTFNGKAVGYVRSTGQEDLSLEDNNATLTFADGVETLSMKFSNWYDVTVTSNDKTNQDDIKFSNYQGQDENHKFTKEEYKNFTYSPEVRGRYDTEFFGEKGKPTEATNTTFMSETAGDKTTSFGTAFGGTTSK